MRPLLLLFIVMPILEMWVLITVGEKIGALPTIGLVLLTAVVGLALLKRQGVSTIMRAQQKMQAGEMPAKEMAEGIFLAVGGALLLTPGFITDAIGFACLIPGIRQVIIGRLLGHVVIVQTTGYTAGTHRQPGHDPSRQGRSHDVIEGDYQREDPREGKREDPRDPDKDG
ncbi:membrane protein FxsA [Microbulbifer salipaludis]|uniref:Membrane protein FxsA n=1 Tax=Microbulbifer salipaludis TaxID=187980 RepID=A0ABS3EA39_9GAMM|nr:FxsA family protein [Microbulbifer salipaludis]MBN8432177.1 membrane protein FxsA [Microbulbifer salipaludis]